MKKLILSVPDRPDDDLFYIDGLGQFTNGTHEISDEQAMIWEQTSGYRWPSQGELTVPYPTGAKPLKPLVAFEEPAPVEVVDTQGTTPEPVGEGV